MYNNMFISVLAGVTTLLILDITWIYFYMGPQYSGLIQTVQKSSLQFASQYAFLAYFLMVVGFCVFAVEPLYSPKKIKLGVSPYSSEAFRIVMRAGIFGFVLYGVYNMTCASVFSQWELSIAWKDMLWGAFVYGISTYASIFTLKFM